MIVVGARRVGLVAAGVLASATVGVLPGPSSRPVEAATDRTAPSAFVPVEPCRLVDTRLPGGPSRLGSGSTLTVAVAGRCGVPGDAVAAAITVTAVDTAAPGFVTAHPSGSMRPVASLLNYVAGDVVANHQLARIGFGGAVDVYTLAAADLVVDVTGYFVPAVDGQSRSGRYVPVGQRRLIDTRDSERPRADSSVRIDVGLADDVTAVIVNVTTANPTEVGFLTAFAIGDRRPTTSILNISRPGQTRASSVVVPVANGGIEIYTSGANHVVVDLQGYFTGSSAPESSDGLFVGASPERLVDSRLATGTAGGPRLWDHGTRELSVDQVTGGPVAAVAANVTVTSTEDAGFVVASPSRTGVPRTSTVNYDSAQQSVANLAVVGVSDHGIAIGALEATHLVVDINGWFTGQPVPGDEPPPRNDPPSDRRVTIIGDSAIAGIRWNGALAGLQGFQPVTHLESCRRLVRPSCRGREGYVPPSAAAQIATLPPAGHEDMLVIAVGYNDWHGHFAADFDAVIDAARRKGFRHIAWVDYRSDVGYLLPGTDGASNYGEMNRMLGEKLESGRFPDVHRWSFDAYTAGAHDWFHGDGVHETRLGSWGVADWISRHVRAFDDRPCPLPWTGGGVIENPCPNPDLVRPGRGLPDIARLYPAAG